LTARVHVKKVDGATGLCVNGDIKPIIGKKKVVKPPTPCQLKLAEKVCKQRRVPKSKRPRCVAVFAKTNPPCTK